MFKSVMGIRAGGLPAWSADVCAMAAGRPHLIDPTVVDHSNRETDRFLESEAGIGELEFQALMRRLDRIDPSYRD